jgi:hypothetical protein
MNLSSLQDFDMQNAGALVQFLDLNDLAHETIYGALMEQLQVVSAHYPLFTTGGITEDWLNLHAEVHASIATALGLPLPVDLDTLDPKDSAQAADWQQNHTFAHQRIEQALGL